MLCDIEAKKLKKKGAGNGNSLIFQLDQFLSALCDKTKENK